MKKFTTLFLALTMMFGLMAMAVACGTSPQEAPTQEASDVFEETSRQKPASGVEPDEPEPESEPEPNEPEPDEPEDEPVRPVSSGAPSDINPVAATKENPAAIGDWAETRRYSTETKEYETVYFRITSVQRGTDEVQAAIDAWNAADHVTVFSENNDPNLEYCMFEYEVYFPENFPAADYGIQSADLSFSTPNPTGGGHPSPTGGSYIGLSSSKEISDRLGSNELYPGDTYHGTVVFLMVADYSGYVFETYYFDDGTRVSSFVAGV